VRKRHLQNKKSAAFAGQIFIIAKFYILIVQNMEGNCNTQNAHSVDY